MKLVIFFLTVRHGVSREYKKSHEKGKNYKNRNKNPEIFNNSSQKKSKKFRIIQKCRKNFILKDDTKLPYCTNNIKTWFRFHYCRKIAAKRKRKKKHLKTHKNSLNQKSLRTKFTIIGWRFEIKFLLRMSKNGHGTRRITKISKITGSKIYYNYLQNLLKQCVI